MATPAERSASAEVLQRAMRNTLENTTRDIRNTRQIQDFEQWTWHWAAYFLYLLDAPDIFSALEIEYAAMFDSLCADMGAST